MVLYPPSANIEYLGHFSVVPDGSWLFQLIHMCTNALCIRFPWVQAVPPQIHFLGRGL